MSRASSAARRSAALAAWAILLVAAVPPAPAQEAPAVPPAAAEAALGGATGQEAPAPPPALLVPGGDYRYDPQGRRDPFKSLLALEQKKRDVALLPPIQQFDLESAKVIGIVVDPKAGAQAMIRAPSGQTFVLKKGTIVGKNDGEVVEITLDGVLVVEKYLDFMNRETRKETFLKSQSGAGK